MAGAAADAPRGAGVPAPIRRAATWWFGPAQTVEDRLFSWLAVLRILVLAHAVALAGEQEVALRRLIRQQDHAGGAAAGSTDLAAALIHLESRPGVQVVTAGPVELRAEMAAELVAVVAACLDNVHQHVGPEPRAWVLLEGWSDRLEISVRDEGPGIPVGRLEAAQADGRLGVSQPIRGRMADLGGTASLRTGPEGTEWKLAVPR